MSTDRISKHFEEAQSVLNDFFNDENLNKIKSAADLMVKSLKSENKIIWLWKWRFNVRLHAFQ